MTFIILACAVPNPKIFYPFFVFLFYALTILPIFIAKRGNSDSGATPCLEFAYFLTAGLVLSAFALPVVLARSDVINWFAASFTILGNIINYGTMFCYVMKDSDAGYGNMF
ncbi:LEPROTL1 family protein [Megaselia abdita]